MDTNLSTISFPEFYDLLRRKYVEVDTGFWAKDGYVAKGLFMPDPFNDGEGNIKRYDEFDTDTYAKVKREGEVVSRAQFGLGYAITSSPLRFGSSISVTWEDRKYNRYSQVRNKILDLSNKVPERLELDATHRFTFADVTSYVNMDGITIDTKGNDGLALISASHTLSMSALTWSNLLGTADVLSKAGIELMEILARDNNMSHFGDIRPIKLNTIITSDNPRMINRVNQILNSTTEVGQANSAVINVQYQKYKHVVLTRLSTTATGARDASKDYWWFLAAINQNDPANTLQWYYSEAEAPHLISPEEGLTKDGERDVWAFHTRGSWAFGCTTGRNIFLSKAAS